ncbi:C-C motif chemokine 3-like [Misgurnus anguillicaudatus]|uniref:C-C motif chemokine 3-like n=1 Tax=Misgurnus anguillicaudatus TaxID=75329 RepID=UPI003CCF9AE6
MRHLMALMFLVIFCSLQLTSSGEIKVPNKAKTICCFKFRNAQIPLKLVKSYYWTDSSCSKPAIVFETDKRKICVDPETSWVSKHIAKVDMKTTTSTTTTITTEKPKPTQS